MTYFSWVRVAVLVALLAGFGPLAPEAAAQSAQAGIGNELNDYRKSNRRKALKYSKTLSQVAAAHARDMVKNNFKSHTGSNGSNVGQRVKRAGYKWCHVSENITWGRRTYAKALAAWAASPGHKKNMLGKKAREYGVAQANGIWVMVFARPC